MNKIENSINYIINFLNNNKVIDAERISDGYHTFEELYYYRMLYNALLVNEISKNNTFKCYKSKRHSDGNLCFGGNWFIVSIELPTGIIDNHYEIRYWNLFKCKEVEKEPNKYDGHTPEDVSKRMFEFLNK